jgi:hypothetical protein
MMMVGLACWARPTKPDEDSQEEYEESKSTGDLIGEMGTSLLTFWPTASVFVAVGFGVFVRHIYHGVYVEDVHSMWARSSQVADLDALRNERKSKFVDVTKTCEMKPCSCEVADLEASTSESDSKPVSSVKPIRVGLPCL